MACWVAPNSRHMVEAVPLGQLGQVGGQDRGPVELTGLDAYPALHQARVGEAERTLGEAELFGPARRLRQLGFGAGEIAAHEATRARWMCANAIGSSAGTTPRQSRAGLLRPGPPWPPRGGKGGIELAAQPRHHPERGLDHRTKPLPALSRPARSDSITWADRCRSARTT